MVRGARVPITLAGWLEPAASPFAAVVAHLLAATRSRRAERRAQAILGGAGSASLVLARAEGSPDARVAAGAGLGSAVSAGRFFHVVGCANPLIDAGGGVPRSGAIADLLQAAAHPAIAQILNLARVAVHTAAATAASTESGRGRLPRRPTGCATRGTEPRRRRDPRRPCFATGRCPPRRAAPARAGFTAIRARAAIQPRRLRRHRALFVHTHRTGRRDHEPNNS